MSGIISGISYSVLFGDTATTTSLLTTALTGATTTTTATSSNPLLALKLAQANQTADIAKEAKDPAVSRDVAAFKSGIAKAKDIKTALANPAVLKVLLTANGLGSQLSYAGLATKALMSDPSDTTSLANQLSGTNAAWLAVAKSFNFFKNGLSALTSTTVQNQLAQGYAEVQWRTSLDKQTPGLSSALTFLSQAKSITTVDQVLGDAVNRDVVLTALSIPQQIAYQTLPTQEAVIASKLNIAKLQDPHFVQTLTQRYLLNKQAATTSDSSSTGVLSLLT